VVYSFEGFVLLSWGFFPCPEYRTQCCKLFVQRSARVSANRVCYSLIKINRQVALISQQTRPVVFLSHTLDTLLVSNFFCVDISRFRCQTMEQSVV